MFISPGQGPQADPRSSTGERALVSLAEAGEGSQNTVCVRLGPEMQAGSQALHFHLPLVNCPFLQNWGGGGAPDRVPGQGQGVQHTPTACHAVPKTSAPSLVCKPHRASRWLPRPSGQNGLLE